MLTVLLAAGTALFAWDELTLRPTLFSSGCPLGHVEQRCADGGPRFVVKNPPTVATPLLSCADSTVVAVCRADDSEGGGDGGDEGSLPPPSSGGTSASETDAFGDGSPLPWALRPKLHLHRPASPDCDVGVAVERAPDSEGGFLWSVSLSPWLDAQSGLPRLPSGWEAEGQLFLLVSPGGRLWALDSTGRWEAAENTELALAHAEAVILQSAAWEPLAVHALHTLGLGPLLTEVPHSLERAVLYPQRGQHTGQWRVVRVGHGNCSSPFAKDLLNVTAPPWDGGASAAAEQDRLSASTLQGAVFGPVGRRVLVMGAWSAVALVVLLFTPGGALGLPFVLTLPLSTPVWTVALAVLLALLRLRLACSHNGIFALPPDSTVQWARWVILRGLFAASVRTVLHNGQQ